MIRVGVIGMSGIGSNHASVYVGNNKSKLVAVCDIVKERADQAAEHDGEDEGGPVQPQDLLPNLR